MLEGLVLTFVLCVLIGYAVNAAVSWWDSRQCASHWESLIRYHQRLLSSTDWLGRRYHRWRIRVAEKRVACWKQSIQHTIQGLTNMQPLSQQPEQKEPSHPC